MNQFLRKAAQHPALARAGPFAVFIALTAGQDLFGGAGPYMFYALKTPWAAWAIWVLRLVIPEMRWALSPGAVVVGVAVFVQPHIALLEFRQRSPCLVHAGEIRR